MLYVRCLELWQIAYCLLRPWSCRCLYIRILLYWSNTTAKCSDIVTNRLLSLSPFPNSATISDFYLTVSMNHDWPWTEQVLGQSQFPMARHSVLRLFLWIKWIDFFWGFVIQYSCFLGNGHSTKLNIAHTGSEPREGRTRTEGSACSPSTWSTRSSTCSSGTLFSAVVRFRGIDMIIRVGG